jgi:hypothetical protein
MPKLIKITTFMDDQVGREEAEKKLTWLVNDGWEIVTSGGGGRDGSPIWGFVVLQKEDPDAVIPPYDEESSIIR